MYANDNEIDRTTACGAQLLAAALLRGLRRSERRQMLEDALATLRTVPERQRGDGYALAESIVLGGLTRA